MTSLAMPLDEGDLDREDFRRSFASHLARLPALQARAFTMREVEGLAPSRICGRLGISEDELGELLFEARLAMCRALAARA